jgi:hypothetical protein
MTDTSIPTTVAPQVLLINHFKTLKLPTFAREYEKVDVNQRAKLSRVEWKTALKSIHSEMINYQLFAGELWSDSDGYNCRNKKATFSQ